MEKATFVYASFEESSTRKHQGTRESIQRFLDNGYYIQVDRNGFYVLSKPGKVHVFLKSSSGASLQLDLKSEILHYYGRARMTPSLFSKFNEDASSGKISFYIENGCCTLSKSDN